MNAHLAGGVHGKTVSDAKSDFYEAIAVIKEIGDFFYGGEWMKLSASRVSVCRQRLVTLTFPM